MNYTFEKPTITPHTLTQQLQALQELLDKRDRAWKESFADTVPLDQCTAFDDDDLDEIRKNEIKRDKWHRDFTKE
jgi:hypothetical protein